MDSLRGSKQDESGLVSLIVVSVITILLALITIGFSRIMDRELRQSLDQDLSTQAYYAAEAGLNDARAYINAIKDNLSAVPNTPNTCQDTTKPELRPYFASNGNISSDGIVKYSCVLIDLNPPELIYDVKAGNAVAFQATSQNAAAPFGNLYFSWENTYYASTSAPQPLGNYPQLPQESSLAANATGLLRVTIYPIYNSGAHYGGNTDAGLAADSRTYFLYPNAGNGTAGTASYASNGGFVKGNCNSSVYPTLPYANATKRYCNSEITGIPTVGVKSIYVSITSVYRDLSVSVQGTDAGNQTQKFSGAEAAVDVTGEGNDILKRLRAHIPYNNSYNYPLGSLSSMQSICKRFRVPKTGPNSWGVAFNDDPTGDPACFLDSGEVITPPPPPPGSITCTGGVTSKSFPEFQNGTYQGYPLYESGYVANGEVYYANKYAGISYHYLTQRTYAVNPAFCANRFTITTYDGCPACVNRIPDFQPAEHIYIDLLSNGVKVVTLGPTTELQDGVAFSGYITNTYDFPLTDKRIDQIRLWHLSNTTGNPDSLEVRDFTLAGNN